jgi:nickel-dependent lactate racemase
MVTAARAVKKGGVIIIASECREGIGHGYFHDLIISCKTAEELYLRSNEDCPELDKWQVQEYAKVLKDHTVILVSSGINKETAERLFLLHADNMRQALAMAFSLKGENAAVNVIPEGPTVLPVVGYKW